MSIYEDLHKILAMAECHIDDWNDVDQEQHLADLTRQALPYVQAQEITDAEAAFARVCAYVDRAEANDAEVKRLQAALDEAQDEVENLAQGGRRKS